MSLILQDQRVAEAIAIRDNHESLATAGLEQASAYQDNLDNFQLHADLYGDNLIMDAIKEADSRGIKVTHSLAQMALGQ